MTLKILFYLKKSHEFNTIIYLALNFKGNRKRLSTGMSIQEKYWDSKKNRVKSSFPSALAINSRLEKIADIARNHFNKYILKNETPDLEDIYNEVKKFIDPMKIDTKVTFESAYKEFLIEREKGKIATNRTLTHYVTILKQLLSLNPKISFKDINRKFHIELIQYLTEEMQYSDNTIGSKIKIIKIFMNWAFKRGYHNNQYYKEMKVFNREVDNVALTLQELDILEALEFTKDNNHLYPIRDLFLLQCYTGLRVSDLMDLEPTNIDYENNVIRVTTKKTKDKILIGISKRIKNVLDRLPDQKIKKIEDQYYNRAIKEICKFAGFDEKIKIVEFRGTKRVTVEYPKYDLITSHTARRTFITVSLKAGVLPESIMKITGHKDRKSFNKYVKIAQNDAIEEVMKVWE